MRTRLVTFLNKKLRTDSSYLLKGGFWLSLAQGIAMLSGLALAVAFANLVTQETYGTYKFVISYMGLLSALSLTGVGASVLRESAKGADRSLILGTLLYLKWSFILAGASICLATYYLIKDNQLLATLFYIAGPLFPILKALSTYTAFLEGKKDFLYKTLFVAIYSILSSVIIIGTLFLTNDPIVIVSVYFVSQIVIAAVLFLYTWRRYKNAVDPEPDFENYSLHLSFMGVLSRVSTRIDNILVFHHLNATQLAIYAFAKAPVTEISGLNGVLKRLVAPKLSVQDKRTLITHLPYKALLYLFVCSGVVVGYWFLAPLFYQIVFPQYLESVYISQIASLGILFYPVMLFTQALVAHKQKRSLYIINTSVAVLKIGLFVVLLSLFGLVGMVATVVIAAGVNALMTLFFFFRMAD